MSLDARAQQHPRGQDAQARCSAQHLRDHARHWHGTKREPLHPDERGRAVAVVDLSLSRRRLLFTPSDDGYLLHLLPPLPL